MVTGAAPTCGHGRACGLGGVPHRGTRGARPPRSSRSESMSLAHGQAWHGAPAHWFLERPGTSRRTRVASEIASGSAPRRNRPAVRYLRPYHFAQEPPAVKGARGRSRWVGGGLRAPAEGLTVGMPLVSGSDPSSPPRSFRSPPGAASRLRRPCREATSYSRTGGLLQDRRAAQSAKIGGNALSRHLPVTGRLPSTRTSRGSRRCCSSDCPRAPAGTTPVGPAASSAAASSRPS
jgi:hypothetical protein